MPTFTKIALETLLEPRIRDSYKKHFDSKQVVSKSVRNGGADDERETEEKEKKKKKPPTPNHIYISPALYVTPEPSPIPNSSSGSLSPSPYVVNHKRRGGEGVNRRIDGFGIQQKNSLDVERSSSCEYGGGDVFSGDDSSVHVQEEVVGDNFVGMGANGIRNEMFVVVDDDFFDPRCDTLSVASSSEANDLGKQAENQSAISNQGEFFDADEDFFSDGCTSNAPSYGPSLESELHAVRLSLLEEIGRRKTAEDALNLMCSQWQRVGNLLSQAGLTFPTLSSVNGCIQIENNMIEQLHEELLVARFVAEAVGKGQACAEAEIAAEAIVESRDQEISQLLDRLQYYETVNHEMSRRNQEVMEAARRPRQRNKSRRRWLWSCLGLSIAIGASVVAYSYRPETSRHHAPLTSSDSSDVPFINSSESSQ